MSLLVAASSSILFATTTGVWAQTDVADAPTDVAVYTYRSQQLEVRWSTSDASSTDSFKIQWKSGSEEFDSSRQLTSDPSASKVDVQSSSSVERYEEIITGLTNGTEHTVRVIATNSQGDSDPSGETAGTPQTQLEQEEAFIEKEVVELFESSYPWLRETWDYVTTQDVDVVFRLADGGQAITECTDRPIEANLHKCWATRVEVGRYSDDLVYTIVHELAHVYTLANGVAETPGPLGAAMVYFYELLPPDHIVLPYHLRVATRCIPTELYADAISLLTLGGEPQEWLFYWANCDFITDAITNEALAVVSSAAKGEMPSWFADTYNDSDNEPDLVDFWLDVKAILLERDRAAAVYQLRDAFGGYCDNLKATKSAFEEGITRNPWEDGGCLPDAPVEVSGSPTGSGKVTVSWQEPFYDGGSPVEGYKVQWKSGSQSYSASRRAVVSRVTDLQESISGMPNEGSYTVRVLAYNHNGDGAASEITGTLTATDQMAPTLLTARLDSYNSWVNLTYDEELDESSKPAGTAFTVNVNGAGKTPDVEIQDNVVTLSIAGILGPSDVVTVSYTVPSGPTATPIKDSAGNNAADFSAQAVRNDKVRVAFTSDPGTHNFYAWNKGTGSQDVIEASLTFSEAVVVSGLPELKLGIGGKTKRAVYHSGSGTTTLAFRYEVEEGDADDDGIEVLRAAVDGLVRYASSKAVAPAKVELSPQTGHLVDAVRPVLVSAGILANQRELILTWDKALDSASVPHPGDRGFYVWDYGNKRQIQISVIAVHNKRVTLTLSSAVSATDQILVSFRIPSLSQLKDTVGNSAAGATAFPVSIVQNANNSPEFPATQDGARNVDENTPAGRNIGDPIRATDADNDRLTYSISGTDAALFDVVSTNGQLRTREALDHESRDSHSFTMSVTDGKDTYGNADTTADDTISVTITINDVDEGPEIFGPSAVDSYDENSAGNVAIYTAADPEGATSTIAWSLSGADREDFTIGSNNGELTFRNIPDYENPADSNRNNEYLVTIVATDQDNLKGRLEVTVTVSDVNEAPTVTGNQSLSFPENGTRSVATYRAADPENDSLTWSVSGADSDDFSISNTGTLTFANIPDFENPADSNQDNEYLVTVEARDEGSNVGKLKVIVTVTNSSGPEEPSITTTSRPHLTYQENGTGTVYTYRATDPQGGTISWSLGGADANDLEIDSNGTLTFSSPPDFESPTDFNRDNVYEVTVVATDGQGLTDTFDVTVTVTNHHENLEPVISTRRPPTTYRELGTNSVYTFRATDPQRGAITWSLEGDDRGDFTITRDSSGRGVLKFARPPDFENPSDADRDNAYEATVVATDVDGHQDKLAFTITVTDVAEDPTISTRPGSGLTYHNLTYPENRTSAVYTYSASDPQRGAINWSVTGVDAGDFTIIRDPSGRGVLTFANQPDYENPSDSDQDRVYEITVVATDEQGLTDELDVRVAVTEVNEGPEISRTSSAPGSVPENQDQETVLARYTATDPEGSVVSGWRTSGADGSDFIINEQGELRFRNVPDYERPADSNRDNEYVFTVQVSDGRNYGSFEETVTVTPVNEPPTITTTSTSATTLRQPENRISRLYTYRAADPEGSSTITWSLGGNDSRFFTITERGEFSFNENNSPDFEAVSDTNRDNVYEVTVQATDDDNNTALLDVTVTVTDVNEGPEVIGGGDTFNVQENRDWGGATFTAVDPEAGTVTRWALGGRDGSDFTITESGAMTFRRTPDHERPDDADRDNVYEVEVRPYDGRYYGSHAVTVTVENVNEISGPDTLSRAESFEGTLATYTAGGRGDLAVTPAWRLTGTDGGDFIIDENGRLTFRSIPDHESPADSNRDNEYLFTVQALDDRYYDTFDVTVTVTPVNEPPTITTTSTSATTLKQPENRASRLYTYRASDPEASSTVAWSLGGNDSRFFTINERGEFSFGPTSPPDFEARADSDSNNVYEVTIQVSDDSSPPNTASLPVTVTVTDVNEGPDITSGANRFTVQENHDLAGARFSATDPENPTEQIARWTLSGRDGGDFTISEQGLMTFRNLPDYERPADSNRNNIYEVEVRPYDGRYYGSHYVTVTVTPVNEAPEITTASASAKAMRHSENRTSRLYTYRATDPEGRAVSWSVSGTHARFFSINERGELFFNPAFPPDYENRQGSGENGNEYQVTVQASDGTLSGTLGVTVTVTDINEGPEVTSGGDTFTVQENSDWPGAGFTASDPEGGAVTRWNLGGRDGGDFTITETGLMTFRNLPDYERPADSDRNNIYEVEVRPYDDRYYGSHQVTVTVTPVDEAPAITTTGASAATMRHSENRTSRLYTYRASDPEGENISWSLGGAHARFFTIDAQRGELFFSESTPPDYENPQGSGIDGQEYQVTVQARDDDNNTASLEVIVTVTDVNEGPDVTGGGVSFNTQENRSWAGASFTASDPEGQTITRWALGGRDGGDFTITETGVMNFRRTPDHERPDDSDRNNIYEVEVRPYDGRYFGSHAVTVTVEDVNEISGSASIIQPENFEGILATYTAAARGDLAVEPAWRLTGTDYGDFIIDGAGQLTFRNIPDYERPADSNRDNVYNFTVQAADDRYFGTLDVTVTVTPVNEAPEITTTSASATTMRHPENRTSRLYTYRATDPERATITWSVTGPHARFFTIDEQRGELFFSEVGAPDFEIQSGTGADSQEYQVTVQAGDGDGAAGRLSVTVTVTDVNEGPEVTGGGASFTVQENRNWAGASFTASDPEGSAITRWALGGRDGSDFTISETGLMTFRRTPDYKRPDDADRDNTYEVEVRPYDGSYYGSHAVTVTVEDVNEIIGSANINRGEAFEGILATYSVTGQGDLTVNPAWRLTGADAGDFTINDHGQLTFRTTPDHERPADSDRDNEYLFTVQASDDRYYGALDVAVTIAPVNEAPVITTKGKTEFTQRENTASILYTYRATDPDGEDSIAWFVEGVDGSDFAIYNGVLSFRLLPDYEEPADSNQDNEYNITVVASDNQGLRDTVDATVTITEVNEGPNVSGIISFTVVEGQELSGASFTANDQEGDQVTRWSLSGSDGGDFTITEFGVMTFRTLPDYDRPADSNRDNEYLVTVRAYDSGNRYGSLEVIVTVTNVNEAAPVVTGSQKLSFRENTANTTRLYTYRATDSDRSTIFTWSVEGTDGTDFTITRDSSGRGELFFHSPPDHEQPADGDRDNVYEITVVASDGSQRGELPVTVTEVNEGPEISGTNTYTISETQDNLANATFTAIDPEGDDVTRWSLAGADGGDFTINDTSDQSGSDTADLAFRNPPDVDRPADSNRDNVYLVTIRAYDNRGRYGSYDVTVTVTGANEPPVITGSSARTFQENGTGAIHTYRAADPESDEFTWIQPGGTDGQGNRALTQIHRRGARGQALRG